MPDLEIKYLSDGREVTVHSETDRGYIVSVNYETEDGESIDSDDPFFASEVFDKPPVARIHQDIERLNAKAHALRQELQEMEKQKRQVTSEAALISARCAQYDALKNVFDFIDGKITHYVTENWDGIAIVRFDDTKSEYSQTRDAKKLLVLFGDSKGCLTWKLNRYADDSDFYTEVTPCRSYEEAIAVASALLTEHFKAEAAEQKYVDNALKIGMPVPEEYLFKIAKGRHTNLKDQLTQQKEGQAVNEKLIKEIEARHPQLAS